MRVSTIWAEFIYYIKQLHLFYLNKLTSIPTTQTKITISITVKYQVICQSVSGQGIPAVHMDVYCYIVTSLDGTCYR